MDFGDATAEQRVVLHPSGHVCLEEHLAITVASDERELGTGDDVVVSDVPNGVGEPVESRLDHVC